MIYIGTCGFCESMNKYFRDYNTIEIQKTFYRLLDEKTLKKWKSKAPKNFVFNFKVFQGITHPLTSPTWKRSNVDTKTLKNVGYLKPTKEVFRFWKIMLRYQKILEAKVLVIQLPKSFRQTEENKENLEKFFSSIERKNFEIGIELRGWESREIKKICKKFDLIDITDPTVRMPVSKKNIMYFRLHGSQKNGRIDYRYEYTKKELKNIAKILEMLNPKDAFIMFNNIYMKKNSKEMKEILKV